MIQVNFTNACLKAVNVRKIFKTLFIYLKINLIIFTYIFFLFAEFVCAFAHKFYIFYWDKSISVHNICCSCRTINKFFPLKVNAFWACKVKLQLVSNIESIPAFLSKYTRKWSVCKRNHASSSMRNITSRAGIRTLPCFRGRTHSNRKAEERQNFTRNKKSNQIILLCSINTCIKHTICDYNTSVFIWWIGDIQKHKITVP